MHNFNFDEKEKAYYTEILRAEVCHKLEFYKRDIINRQKNIEKHTGEIKSEETAVSECQTEIAAIEAKLQNEDSSVAQLLFRDFKTLISNLLNGPDA